MSPRALPLALRIPLLAVGLMVMVGLVASHQVLAALGATQTDRLREIAGLHLGALATALGPAVLRRDVWEVYDTLDRATTAQVGQRMLLTVVTDDRGRVIAASDPRRVPVDTVLPADLEAAQNLDALDLTGAAPLRVGAPLIYQGRAVGRIVAELDVSDLIAERAQALRLLIWGNTVATLLIAGAGGWAMRRMLRPLATLSRAMRGQVPVSPADLPREASELGRLLRLYNRMLDALAAKAEAERRLAERERFVSLGRLSSSLAHEINNPLGGLLNATDTIRAYPDRPDVVRDAADLLDRGLRHLRDVARATLEQNRFDREGQPLAAADFEDLKLLFAPEAARLGQRLDWQTPAEGADLAWVPAAPVRQIVLNLCLNAAAAAGQGGAVGLEVVAAPEALTLSLRDDGPGMSAEALHRLLGDAPVAPGGGVGLRLVRDLVRSLGGQIAHRREDGWTVLTVQIARGAVPC